MILTLHISRAVFYRILAVAAALTGLALALDLVESATDVMARGEGGLWRYVALRTPLIVTAVLPVALIAGPVLAFLSMAGRNEFIIMRAAGATSYRILVSLIPLAALLGLGYHLLADRVAPRMEAALTDWLDETPPQSAGAFWARTRGGVVRVGASAPSGQALFDVDIYETDPAGRMTARIDAETARYEPGGWRLSGAKRLIPGEARSADVDGMLWEAALTPDNIRALASPGRSLAGGVASKMLRGEFAGNRSDAFYEVRVYRGYAVLLIPAVMILLAAPATFGARRAGRLGARAAYATVAGFGFLLADGMLTSLGESGKMIPAIAAFGGAALFAAIGGWTLVTLEEQ